MELHNISQVPIRIRDLYIKPDEKVSITSDIPVEIVKFINLGVAEGILSVNPDAAETEEVDDLWIGLADKLYLQSGQFTSTLKTNQNITSIDVPTQEKQKLTREEIESKIMSTRTLDMS